MKILSIVITFEMLVNMGLLKHDPPLDHKCRNHWHQDKMIHNHCIPMDKNWTLHEKYGHDVLRKKPKRRGP